MSSKSSNNRPTALTKSNSSDPDVRPVDNGAGWNGATIVQAGGRGGARGSGSYNGGSSRSGGSYNGGGRHIASNNAAKVASSSTAISQTKQPKSSPDGATSNGQRGQRWGAGLSLRRKKRKKSTLPSSCMDPLPLQRSGRTEDDCYRENALFAKAMEAQRSMNRGAMYAASKLSTSSYGDVGGSAAGVNISMPTIAATDSAIAASVKATTSVRLKGSAGTVARPSDSFASFSSGQVHGPTAGGNDGNAISTTPSEIALFGGISKVAAPPQSSKAINAGASIAASSPFLMDSDFKPADSPAAVSVAVSAAVSKMASAGTSIAPAVSVATLSALSPSKSINVGFARSSRKLTADEDLKPAATTSRAGAPAALAASSFASPKKRVNASINPQMNQAHGRHRKCLRPELKVDPSSLASFSLWSGQFPPTPSPTMHAQPGRITHRLFRKFEKAGEGEQQ